MKRALKYLLLLLVFATIGVPMADMVIGFIPKWPLNGSFDAKPEPEFVWKNWFEGSYQSSAEPWLNEQIGGREYLVRLRNQYYFSVFNLAKANAVTPAKDGVLLDFGYVDAFYGKDFAGEEFLTDRLRRWKRVQHGLDPIGVKAFLAFAPGKASFFEDKFSDVLRDEHRPTTNYRFMKDWGTENGLRMLDLKQVFHNWSDTSRYPLFPKGGIHWTEYSVAHVCDTLSGYIQSITGRPLQKFWFDIEISDTARGGDNDIAQGMNLLFTPKKERLAYPKRYFGEDTTIVPPKFLVIADSYYYTIVYSGFPDRVARHGGFWYYFQETYPSEIFSSRNVAELDILGEIKKQDVLMLMMTEPQLPRFGWGAVEKLEELLYPQQDASESSAGGT